MPCYFVVKNGSKIRFAISASIPSPTCDANGMLGERSDARGQVPARVIEQRCVEVTDLPVGQQANECAVALERPREMLRKHREAGAAGCRENQRIEAVRADRAGQPYLGARAGTPVPQWPYRAATRFAAARIHAFKRLW
ncbi:hypothetical protein WS75_15980 [Burkholderia sp. FL-7-2-10-S1-D7]|nr:hypothetical protein WS75_15980 [Burkholderia sp. FL-7-2-10-S1-D7]